MEDSPNPRAALVNEPMKHRAELSSPLLQQTRESRSRTGRPRHFAKLLICLLDAVLVQVRPEGYCALQRAAIDLTRRQTYNEGYTTENTEIGQYQRSWRKKAYIFGGALGRAHSASSRSSLLPALLPLALQCEAFLHISLS